MRLLTDKDVMTREKAFLRIVLPDEKKKVKDEEELGGIDSTRQTQICFAMQQLKEFCRSCCLRYHDFNRVDADKNDKAISHSTNKPPVQ